MPTSGQSVDSLYERRGRRLCLGSLETLLVVAEDQSGRLAALSGRSAEGRCTLAEKACASFSLVTPVYCGIGIGAHF
jgi:hypothetical protein